MKLLFLARALGPGGAERQMALLAAGLQRRGHEVAVATFYPGGIFRGHVIDAGVRHISLDKKGRWDVVRFAGRLRRLLKELRPQALYSFLPTANILAALFGSYPGRPHIIWGVRVSEMDLGYYGWAEKLSYAFERQLAPAADLLVFNSESGWRSALARQLAPGRCMVIPNGIDISAFAPDSAARRGLREAWGIRDGETIIGMIGRFDPMKDHATFLRAARMLVNTRPDIRIVLAGTGVEAGNPRLDGLLSDREMAERTIRLGERRDMHAVMAALDILCLSSAFGEGFPNVLGEAMAAGTPCVATDVGDARMIVGDTGEIAPPRDAAALAGAADALLTRLARSPEAIRRRARERIVTNFSLERMVERSEHALVDLLNHGTALNAPENVSTQGS